MFRPSGINLLQVDLAIFFNKTKTMGGENQKERTTKQEKLFLLTLGKITQKSIPNSQIFANQLSQLFFEVTLVIISISQQIIDQPVGAFFLLAVNQGQNRVVLREQFLPIQQIASHDFCQWPGIPAEKETAFQRTSLINKTTVIELIEKDTTPGVTLALKLDELRFAR